MNEMNLFNLSAYLQWAGSFFILLLVFAVLKKRSREVYSVGIYGVASFTFQALQFLFFFFLKGRYNTIIGNIYFPVEITTLLAIYYFAFKPKFLKSAVVVFGVGTLIFYLITISNQLSSLNANTEAVRDFVMIVCSIVYFYFLLRELPQENLLHLPMFWVNAAVLFYFSCTFVLSLSLDYLIEIMKNNLVSYWTFRNFLRVLFCSLICVGIWQSRKKTVQRI